MRLVGIARDGGVVAGSLADDGGTVREIAPLADFWADPARHLAAEPTGAPGRWARSSWCRPCSPAHGWSASG
ncbi:hypothetical protein ACFQX8_11980 [Klenkia terrae]|uniref:hypothetical protein n=1 Tax=Klenkia terrae TaxID=1052259 RepID=UPI00361D32E9